MALFGYYAEQHSAEVFVFMGCNREDNDTKKILPASSKLVKYMVRGKLPYQLRNPLLGQEIDVSACEQVPDGGGGIGAVLDQHVGCSANPRVLNMQMFRYALVYRWNLDQKNVAQALRGYKHLFPVDSKPFMFVSKKDLTHTQKVIEYQINEWIDVFFEQDVFYELLPSLPVHYLSPESRAELEHTLCGSYLRFLYPANEQALVPRGPALNSAVVRRALWTLDTETLETILLKHNVAVDVGVMASLFAKQQKAERFGQMAFWTTKKEIRAANECIRELSGMWEDPMHSQCELLDVFCVDGGKRALVTPRHYYTLASRFAERFLWPTDTATTTHLVVLDGVGYDVWNIKRTYLRKQILSLQGCVLVPNSQTGSWFAQLVEIPREQIICVQTSEHMAALRDRVDAGCTNYVIVHAHWWSSDTIMQAMLTIADLSQSPHTITILGDQRDKVTLCSAGEFKKGAFYDSLMRYHCKQKKNVRNMDVFELKWLPDDMQSPLLRGILDTLKGCPVPDEYRSRIIIHNKSTTRWCRSVMFVCEPGAKWYNRWLPYVHKWCNPAGEPRGKNVLAKEDWIQNKNTGEMFTLCGFEFLNGRENSSVLHLACPGKDVRMKLRRYGSDDYVWVSGGPVPLYHQWRYGNLLTYKQCTVPIQNEFVFLIGDPSHVSSDVLYITTRARKTAVFVYWNGEHVRKGENRLHISMNTQALRHKTDALMSIWVNS